MRSPPAGSRPSSTSTSSGRSTSCAREAGIDQVTRTLALEGGPPASASTPCRPGPVEDAEVMRRLAPTEESVHIWTEAVPVRRFASSAEPQPSPRGWRGWGTVGSLAPHRPVRLAGSPDDQGDGGLRGLGGQPARSSARPVTADSAIRRKAGLGGGLNLAVQVADGSRAVKTAFAPLRTDYPSQLGGDPELAGSAARSSFCCVNICRGSETEPARTVAGGSWRQPYAVASAAASTRRAASRRSHSPGSWRFPALR